MELYGVMLMKEDNKTEDNKTKQNTEHISLVQNISKLISFLLTVR